MKLLLCIILPISVFIAAYSYAETSTNAPITLYRINVESGVVCAHDAKLTAEDVQAIQRMNRLLKRWPSMLWLAQKDGKLIAVKIGLDGKPAKIGK